VKKDAINPAMPNITFVILLQISPLSLWRPSVEQIEMSTCQNPKSPCAKPIAQGDEELPSSLWSHALMFNVSTTSVRLSEAGSADGAVTSVPEFARVA